jgi:hypothetical protein
MHCTGSCFNHCVRGPATGLLVHLTKFYEINRDDSETGASEVNLSDITVLGMVLELPTSLDKYVPIKMNIFSAFFLLRPHYITSKGVRRLSRYSCQYVR